MLTAEELRQIDRLSPGRARPIASASACGARVARARGAGLEFYDFRPYQPGDDLRRVDWTVHARLRHLVVKLFRSDAHLRIHLLVDTSASMRIGTPDKLSCARKVAAVLSYIAIRASDAVGMATFDSGIRRHIAPASGVPQLVRIFEMLRTVRGDGRSDVNRALADYSVAVTGPGLVVVLSDFFHERGAYQGLRALLHRNLTPAVVQIVAPEESNPRLRDEMELVDIEDPDAARLVADARSVAAYQHRFARLSADLGEFCVTHALPYLRMESSAPFAGLLRECVTAGLVGGEGESRWS